MHCEFTPRGAYTRGFHAPQHAIGEDVYTTLSSFRTIILELQKMDIDCAYSFGWTQIFVRLEIAYYALES